MINQIVHLFGSVQVSGEFDPTTYPGSVLWLDGQDDSVFTLSGSDVTQWRDKSSSLNHADSITSPLRTADGVEFDSSNSELLELPVAILGESWTYFMVFRNLVNQNHDFLGQWYNNVANRTRLGLVNSPSGGFTMQIEGNTFTTSSITFTNTGTPIHVMVIRRDGVGSNNITVFKNGSGSEQGTVAGVLDGQETSIGGRTQAGSDSFADIEIKEIYINNTAMSDTDVNDIISEFETKWGL